MKSIEHLKNIFLHFFFSIMTLTKTKPTTRKSDVCLFYLFNQLDKTIRVEVIATRSTFHSHFILCLNRNTLVKEFGIFANSHDRD